MAISLCIVGAPVMTGAPPYDGAWRNACGDPALRSELYYPGPSGKVTHVVDSRTVKIATPDDRSITVELAGLHASDGTKTEIESLLIGRNVVTVLETDQEGRRLVGRLERDGHDVGLQLLLSGHATFRPSKHLGGYSHCLYEEAQKAAAAPPTEKGSVRKHQ